MILPVIQQKRKPNKTIFSFAYQEDLDQAYAFYCARYKLISYYDFLNLGLFEFKKLLGSIPENEPLFNIIKSRTINTAQIKDKEERKYWNKLKQMNRIPDLYLSNQEIFSNLKQQAGSL